MFLPFSLQSITHSASLMQSQLQHMPRQTPQIQGSLSFNNSNQGHFSMIFANEGDVVIRKSDASLFHVQECYVFIEGDPLSKVTHPFQEIYLSMHPNLFQEFVRLKVYIDQCNFIERRLEIDFEEPKTFLGISNVVAVRFDWHR
jgi:hypothetical protein